MRSGSGSPGQPSYMALTSRSHDSPLSVAAGGISRTAPARLGRMDVRGANRTSASCSGFAGFPDRHLQAVSARAEPSCDRQVDRRLALAPARQPCRSVLEGCQVADAEPFPAVRG